MYRVSYSHRAARAVLHDTLPSIQISWRFLSTVVGSLLRLMGSVFVQGALEAGNAVGRAAATVAPQPHLLALTIDGAARAAELAPQREEAPTTLAPRPRGLLELAHELLGLRLAYARVALRRQRPLGRR